MHPSISFSKALSFTLWSCACFLLRIVFFPPVRAVLLRIFGATVGKDTVILTSLFLNVHHHGFSRLHIGNRVFVGDEVMLDVRGGIRLGDDVTLSNRVNLVTHMTVGYPEHPLTALYPTKESAIIIKNGAYVGTAATILPGVTVGACAVVAAGAVVTRDVPPRTVVAGVPARVVKKLHLPNIRA